MDVDDREFQKRMVNLENTVSSRLKRAAKDIASEILRRSTEQVPHRDGVLQGSGFVKDNPDGSSEVGYGGNAAPYAARLHEHPEYRFKKGRKGKYLEDPIKDNQKVWGDYFLKAVKDSFSTK